MRYNLNGDSFGLHSRLIPYVVDVSTADVSKAFAYTAGLERAVVLVNRDGAFNYCD